MYILIRFSIELYLFMCVRVYALCTPSNLILCAFIHSWQVDRNSSRLNCMVFASNYRQDFLISFLSSIVCWVRERERGAWKHEHKEIIIPFNCGSNSAVVWTNKRKWVHAWAWANSLAGQNELVFIAFSIQSPCQFSCRFSFNFIYIFSACWTWTTIFFCVIIEFTMNLLSVKI